MGDGTGEGKRNGRISVVLEPELAEHIRVRAFQQRVSKSAYVRLLVLNDRDENPVSAERLLGSKAHEAEAQ